MRGTWWLTGWHQRGGDSWEGHPNTFMILRLPGMLRGGMSPGQPSMWVGAREGSNEEATCPALDAWGLSHLGTQESLLMLLASQAC